ncbi:hypothetical protein KEM54_005215 [Ascosphaera aggregata]|nr:hypothetical protein KEM54_005215 [Ascosphaera aggregata]
MATASSPSKPIIDRQTVVPFHLKLFYSQNAFHSLSDFPTPTPGSDYIPPLPPHLQIYTWQSCTLRELATLLTSALPSLLPDPAVGTRICFRLVYPDTKGAIMAGPDSKGRFMSKDMGSVIVGAQEEDDGDDVDNGRGGDREGKASDTGDQQQSSSEQTTEGAKPPSRTKPLKLHGDDADKTLQDMRFVIGDYIDCAIQSPLADGSVAPPLPAPRNDVRSANIGGGMRAFGAPEDMGSTGSVRNGYGYGGGNGVF